MQTIYLILLVRFFIGFFISLSYLKIILKGKIEEEFDLAVIFILVPLFGVGVLLISPFGFIVLILCDKIEKKLKKMGVKNLVDFLNIKIK